MYRGGASREWADGHKSMTPMHLEMSSIPSPEGDGKPNCRTPGRGGSAHSRQDTTSQLPRLGAEGAVPTTGRTQAVCGVHPSQVLLITQCPLSGWDFWVSANEQKVDFPDDGKLSRSAVKGNDDFHRPHGWTSAPSKDTATG